MKEMACFLSNNAAEAVLCRLALASDKIALFRCVYELDIAFYGAPNGIRRIFDTSLLMRMKDADALKFERYRHDKDNVWTCVASDDNLRSCKKLPDVMELEFRNDRGETASLYRVLAITPASLGSYIWYYRTIKELMANGITFSDSEAEDWVSVCLYLQQSFLSINHHH
jgi:hypothetical protein